MQDRKEAHRRFVEFTCAFYRSAGWEAPVFESNPDTAVAFMAHVDDIAFSIGYDPLGGESCLFVYCVFGAVSPNIGAQPLRRLLERNGSSAHEYGTYCIDASTQELACHMRRTTDVDIGTLKADMAALAAQAHQWRRNGDLADDAQVGTAGGKANELSVWTARFA
ncbi:MULTISPECIES: CesT family type III secretion system chaperone [unclassified Variovorax]|uniref:CesT family type III secretion system chaperone n=1 Tax=unclassified Variovorax TaxID=663243 RepID=UPI00076D5207|nr:MULTISPECIES: CesT family type III secretion system chaperone [unclassified Variovorax]KWT83836.1 hypothetical protein APY03_4391 [Variovorax sp. WDL1]PNG46515.1 hypothetical protein CHC06_06857 [Variovorax sp. B2]PNG47663.1 hypothetical protein CHC07_06830 [Variovorax sp. B4]VTV14273.1 hypothetical protein WDL1CHR_04830 [Variovorax sp. WDL1]